jgi:hypothetical protein
VAGLERLKHGLDTVKIRLAMLAADRVEPILESSRLELLFVVKTVASSRVSLEVSKENFDLLVDKFILASLELVERLG